MKSYSLSQSQSRKYDPARRHVQATRKKLRFAELLRFDYSLVERFGHVAGGIAQAWAWRASDWYLHRSLA